MDLRLRSTVVFLLVATASFVTWLFLRRDAPVPVIGHHWPTLIMPGFVFRGLLSGSELGFGDWRDPLSMVFGSAAAYTSLYVAADLMIRGLRRRASQ